MEQLIAPLPRISIQAFCETAEVMAIIHAVAEDRRAERAHIKVQMGGADAARPTYPTTRGASGMTGQYLDIALHNDLKPGVEAQDLVPSGLELGKSLTLTPPESEPGRTGSTPGKVPDVEIRISEYWGCGASVRPGQPKVATFKVKGGDKAFDPKNMQGMQGVDFQSTGSLSRGLFAPDRDIDIKPGYVYWPSRKYGKQVLSSARLAGQHAGPGDPGQEPGGHRRPGQLRGARRRHRRRRRAPADRPAIRTRVGDDRQQGARAAVSRAGPA